MRLKELRLEKGREQAELAIKVGTNAPMFSCFEHYKCLPVPEMLVAICNELECKPDDIYQRHEMYVDVRARAKTTITECGDVVLRAEPLVYKLSVRLPEAAREKLTPKNLEKCGYHSLKDLIWHSVQEFFKRLNEIEQSGGKDENSRNGKRNT